MACICEQNMMQVKREKRKPSKTPSSVKTKASGPGMKPSHPSKFCPTQRKKNHATIPSPNTDMTMMYSWGGRERRGDREKEGERRGEEKEGERREKEGERGRKREGEEGRRKKRVGERHCHFEVGIVSSALTVNRTKNFWLFSPTQLLTLTPNK